jgi:chemotaxis protein MotA
VGAWGALLVSSIIEGTNLRSLLAPSAFILVIGGTLGATIISYSMEDVAALPKVMTLAFKKQDTDPLKFIDLLVEFAEKARREGLLILQEFIKDTQDKFLVRGMNLVIDGADPELVRNILETEIVFLEKRHNTAASMFETAGGFAPTMGIIGTVVGLITVLGNIEDSAALSKGIAVAFLATFYGIGTANLLWLPLGNKLKLKSKVELLIKEMILEGILSIQAGENPRIVREKLEVFLPPKLQQAAKEQDKEKGGGPGE